MGSNVINLTIRFLLELSALAAMGIWGWKQSDGLIRVVLAVGIPIVAAALWGIFAVPNDPSRSGSAPIAIPGVLRLIMELLFFAFAVWTLFKMGYNYMGLIIGILVAVHYIFSYDRIMWLLKQ